MARYSIEILDGERSGEVVALDGERFTIGRKPGNSLVLKDDSLSGVHAEIVMEDGSILLRDLGSTNGTKIDGKKIDEVPLSHGDEIHLGKVKVRFRVEGGAAAAGGAPAAVGDASADLAAVIRIDQNSLARAGARRSSLPMVAVLLVALVAAGGAAWWFLFNQGGDSQIARRQPLQVAGNKLAAAAADLEIEGAYDLAAGGAGFALGTRAHSGRFALETQLTAEAPWAVARLLAPIAVTPGTGLAVTAYVAGADTARAGVRLLFGLARTAGAASTSDGTPAEPPKRPALLPGGLPAPDQLVAGTDLVKLGSAFQQVSAAVEVPPGVDQCSVLLVAAGSGVASVDDVAVVEQAGTFPQQEVAGRRVLLGTGWPSLRSAEGLVIRSLSPVLKAEAADDAALKGLAAAGLLLFQDLGQPGGAAAVKASAEGSALRLTWAGRPGLQLRLVVPADHVAGVQVQAAAEGGAMRWTVQPGQFQVARGQAVLVGSKLNQFKAAVPQPGPVTGATQEDQVVLLLPGEAGSVDLQVDFAKELEDVARRLKDARNAKGQGKAGEARARFLSIEEELPFDDTALEEARTQGAQLKADFERSLQEVDRLMQDARFFDNRGTFGVVQRRLQELATLHQGSAQDVAEIDKRQQEVGTRLEQLRTVDAQRRASSLLEVARALEEDKQEPLARFIRDYIARRHPEANAGGDSKPADGKGGK